MVVACHTLITANESVKLAQSDTGATSPFPFMFVMGRCAKVKQGDYESFKEPLEHCLAKNVREV
jgi:hypothetical protein